jgi:UDP-N-acetylglucosamine diphosphorylase / glucose-1-phosphate thymidylyltransferase / UDP-N-acetylgalactosamine diphosphorylase / glucosamine-1-phosphate N-acetyltransferase / galactosamine-1-phosphate N-acetyltransferase
MNLIIYEDQKTALLEPFTLNHASFEIKVAVYSNLDRFIRFFNDYDICLIVRPELVEIVSEKFPQYQINPTTIKSGYCINGSVVWNQKSHDRLLLNKLKDSELSFYNSKDNILLTDFYNLKYFKKSYENNNHLLKINYLWDTLDILDESINEDFNTLELSKSSINVKTTKCVDENKIYVSPKSKVREGVILDAAKGPIIIRKNAVVDIGSLIQGPVLIDENAYISPGAKIRPNTLIGPGCKVGGEITNTIFHANSNKVHDGFLGHSYVGEWVNIGAGTNNSNLKNNYGEVKFNFKNKNINTKRIFLGSMIGDFTRIGISTMLNTGTYIGLGANVFGSGFQNKFIKSFSWGHDKIVDFNKLIDTCNAMMARRNKSLTDTELKLLKGLYLEK